MGNRWVAVLDRWLDYDAGLAKLLLCRMAFFWGGGPAGPEFHQLLEES